MEQAASQFLRAVRGRRSQIAFARRLGYRGNPITDWEHGRRFPTGTEALRACGRVGIDVAGAFGRFHAAPAPRPEEGAAGVARWLSEVRGSASISALSEQVGRSRYALSRWLAGQAEPRLPDFFRTVDALTGRLPDLVAELVPIREVPALVPRFETVAAARRLAFEAPWTEAVLRVLETEGYRQRPHSGDYIAGILGLPTAVVDEAIARLAAADIIRRQGQRFLVAGALSVDTRANPEGIRDLMTHWSEVALARYPARGETDWFAYNVMSLSRPDLARVRELLRATYREIRAIVAASEPTETAALLNVQLISWGDDDGQDRPETP